MRASTFFRLAVRLQVTLLSLVFAAATGLSFAQPRPSEPDIHRELPVREPSNLSPPIVAKPINACARTVHVSGAVPRTPPLRLAARPVASPTSN